MERCHFPMLLLLHDRGPRSQGTLGTGCPISSKSYRAQKEIGQFRPSLTKEESLQRAHDEAH